MGLRAQVSGKAEEASLPKEEAQEESKGAKGERKEYEERPINSPEDFKKRDEDHEEVKEVVEQGFNP